MDLKHATDEGGFYHGSHGWHGYKNLSYHPFDPGLSAKIIGSLESRIDGTGFEPVKSFKRSPSA
jgi:hypothetical protein